ESIDDSEENYGIYAGVRLISLSAIIKIRLPARLIDMTKTKLLLSLLFFLFSCREEKRIGGPIGNAHLLQKSLMSFLQYRQNHLRPYEDFKALDASSSVITKENFLQLLSTGGYLPLKLSANAEIPVYQLYEMSDSSDQELRSVIREWGRTEYEQYKAEGKLLPDYRIVDLDGNIYTKENTKGKILVLKCWFINCLPCRQEMPALNKLKQQYNDRNDIIFLSLCLDPVKDVKEFLSHTRFDYATAAGQEKFISRDLSVEAYPTHFVIDRRGAILKKTTEYDGLAYALERAALQ
ncbi:MAG TPA: TlpA disulfide reductase family protein, partial [Flavisolibacter sp.]|nr:TlpA disulfide reductase family protein [Flavisolibacter sp.]